MTPDERTIAFLRDISEHCSHALSFVANRSQSDFEGDLMLQFAVARTLEVIGEAAKLVPDSARTLAPKIPWKQITAMRDKLIHHYFGVDPQIVWDTVVNDVPVLQAEVDELISKLTA